MDYCRRVPWGLPEIFKFIVCVICYCLISWVFVPKLIFKPKLFIVIDIAMLMICILILKYFIIADYNNGWEMLLKSNTNYPHRKKIAVLLGLIMGSVIIVRNFAVVNIPKSLSLEIILRFVFSYGIISPFVEELWFRSFVYRGLKNKLGIGRSVCGSSLLFAVYHFMNFTWPVLIIGPLLALYYEKTGYFKGCVLAHSICNLSYLAFLLIFPRV